MAPGTQRASTEAALDWMETRSVGDFVLQDEIGRGGMGVVYRAMHAPTGRLAAVKILPALHGSDPEAVARFHREADAAARIQHGGIVPVLGSGQQGDLHWMAMGYVEGVPLDQLIGSLRGFDPGELRGTLAEETGLAELLPAHRPRLAFQNVDSRYARSCAALCAELADALQAAHDAGVVHRDVKPGNLLLDRRGRVVVVDFGLALDFDGMRLTRSGDVVGTPCYMSPEQARGGVKLDERVDVYGLGATLFELLTLRPPFDGEHAAEILRCIVSEPARSVRSLEPSVPMELARLVDACLEKNPADRPADMATLGAALRAVAAADDRACRRLRGSAGRLRRTLREQARRAFVVALILLVTAGLCAFFILRSRDQRETRGLREVAAARAHLAAGRFLPAESSYARAGVLLGDGRVQEARRRHLGGLFEQLYATGRFAELTQWLCNEPVAARDATWAEWLERARGRGRLDVRLGEQVVKTVHVRRAGLLGSLRPLQLPGSLPVGEWLVMVPTAEGAIAEEAVAKGEVADAPRQAMPAWRRRVRIERDAATVVDLPLLQAPESGSAPVPVLTGSGAEWLERELLEDTAHAALLRSLEDFALRAELEVPGVADVLPAGGPALGFAPRDAATLAALLGGHLAGPRRFASELTSRTDPPEIVAGSGEAGGTAAGPTFEREPRSTFLLAGPDGNRPVAADARVPGAGMRLARFAVPTTRDEAAAREVLEAQGALRRAGAPWLSWSVDHEAAAPLSLQVDSAERAPYPAEGVARAWPGGLLLRLPLAGIGSGDRAVDLESTSSPFGLELRLPAAAAVDRCEPAADARLHDAEGLRLSWFRPETVERLRLRGCARVEARIDGLLSSRQPARSTVRQILEQQRQRLEPGDASGSHAPLVVDRVGAVGTSWSADVRTVRTIRDPLGRPIRLDRQPVTVWIDASGARPEVLHAAPARRLDRGVWLAPDRYANEIVGVTVTLPTDAQAVRSDDLPWALQLRIEPRSNSLRAADAAVIATGCAARGRAVSLADSELWARLYELSGGLSTEPRARLLSEPAEHALGPAGPVAVVTDWLLPSRSAAGGFRRERWWLVRLSPVEGDGELLLRVGAGAPTPGEARLRFAEPAVHEWLRSVREAFGSHGRALPQRHR